MYKLSSKSKERLQGIDPRLISIINEALKISVIDFGIPSDGGLRTAERQKELFDKKVSKCDGTYKQNRIIKQVKLLMFMRMLMVRLAGIDII